MLKKVFFAVAAIVALGMSPVASIACDGGSCPVPTPKPKAGELACNDPGCGDHPKPTPKPKAAEVACNDPGCGDHPKPTPKPVA